MVANVNSPNFSGGANIAIKCPYHTYEQTIAFYRDTLGLPLLEEEAEGCIFQFGPVRLWIDRVPNLSHPDIWLELETNDTESCRGVSQESRRSAPRRSGAIARRLRRVLDFRSGRRDSPRRRRRRLIVRRPATFREGWKLFRKTSSRRLAETRRPVCYQAQTAG